MENSIFEHVYKAFKAFVHDLHTMCAVFIVSVLGYFLPIKDIMNLLIFFFVLDVFFGYLAARKLRNERFSVKIIWNHTIPRMLVSIVLVTAAYMWDTIYNQDFVKTYKIIGWFISGVLLVSIAMNGYKITKWSIFLFVGHLVGKNLKNKIDTNTKKEKENE